MSFAQTIGLGALAGAAIFLSLPLGRLRLLDTRMRVGLAMFSVGILVFLLVDVLANGLTIVHGAVDSYRHHHGSLGHAIALTALLLGGFTLGSAGLGVLELRLRPRSPVSPPIGGGTVGTFAEDHADRLLNEAAVTRRLALRTGLIIAAAIGIHNLAEGLAIGVSARAGQVSLATVLIIGFALHNSTEGFGIVGPLGPVRPSWRWIGLAGLIGGGPTFIGAMIGYGVTSHPLELLFYAVAGGAILYVIGEIWLAMRRYGHSELAMILLALGFFAGVLTDLVVSLGGG